MSANKIEQLLQKELGLELSPIGRTAIKKGLNKRMQTLNIDRIDRYVEELESSAHELNELIDAVVIPETWFFRNTHPFVVVNSFVAKQLARKKGRVVKLLSAPCASGEEAYSLAIALVESGVGIDQFQIHGIDISGRALERANKGIYRENSFRENDLPLRYKYFHKKENLFILSDRIKKMVHFHRGNILDNDFVRRFGIFDVLFCRNLLIYLDRQAQKRAFANIKKLLAADGILFVGHAESGLLDRKHFRSTPYPKAFAFYRSGIEQRKAVGKQPAGSQKMKTYHASLLAGSYKYSTTSRSKPVNAHDNAAATGKFVEEPNLFQARQLTDQRRYSEATVLLKDFLGRNGTSAEAYYLLGLIRVESGDTKEGTKLLRRAVYLQPDHIAALSQLSLLAERAGDFARAKIFEERIQRLKTSQTEQHLTPDITKNKYEP